ncbi:MAG: D-alanyl-D-alanine carboxypeptidase [Clostridia bacterium]|nr:D-alanyl-D-alanine carboxypeptidase [Clostridia bacterium]
MKRILGLILSAVLLVCLIPASFAAETGDVIVSGTLNLDAKGAILMEASTGTVLYEQDSKEKLYPASVTKVMTMLLVMESLDEGKISEDDPVTASENAVSYGGTQIYLEVGETMSLRDLLKAVAINSANDAAAALAEHVSGSEPAFVERMNARAKELGAENTHFVNPCGLPDPDHYTCAYDVALMTRELLTYPHILDYTGIWMDSLRDGGFGLANTNKLLKTYEGMTGMKTGYTEAAGHCLSATATRGDVSLIAVILGGETSKGRFASAASLLDYGFGNYTLVRRTVGQIAPIPVTKGRASSVSVAAEGEYRAVLKKGKQSDLTVEIETEPSLKAPVAVGQIVGKVRFFLNGTEVSSVPVVAVEAVEKAGFFDYLARLADCLF